MEQTIEQRVAFLERDVKANAEDIAAQGGTLDHVVKTIDTILVPTQDAHTKDLIEVRQRTQASHDFIVKQDGFWAALQRIALVIGAVSAVATLVMKVMGK